MDKSDSHDIKPLSIIKQDVMLSGTTTASQHPMQTILSIPAHHNINSHLSTTISNNINNNSMLTTDIKTITNSTINNNNTNVLNNSNNLQLTESLLSTLQQHQLHQIAATSDTSPKTVALNHTDLLNSLQNLQNQQIFLNNSLQLPASSTNQTNSVQHLLIPVSIPTNQVNLLNGQLFTTPQQLAFTLPNNNSSLATSQTLQPVFMVGPQLGLIMGQVNQNNQNIQNLALRQLVQQQQQQLSVINNGNNIANNANTNIGNNTSNSSIITNTLINNTNGISNTGVENTTTVNNTQAANNIQATSVNNNNPVQPPLFAITNPQLLQQTLAAMVSKNLQHKIILSPNNTTIQNNVSTTTPTSTTTHTNTNLLTTITLVNSLSTSSVLNTMTSTSTTITLPSGLKIITSAPNNNNSKVLSQVTQVLINSSSHLNSNNNQLNNTETTTINDNSQQNAALIDQSSVLTSSINQLLPNTISSSRDGTVIDGVNLDEMREFAKQFKLRRLSLGLTQTQVGQALSITEGPSYSQSAICRFEKLDITPKSAQKIKPVLEKWMSMAEERLKMGGQALTDYGGLDYSKKRKRRTSFTPSAIETLNEHFEMNSHPTGTEMTTLADQLNFDREVIRVWFCNKRQTLKNTIKKFKAPSSPLS